MPDSAHLRSYSYDQAPPRFYASPTFEPARRCTSRPTSSPSFPLESQTRQGPSNMMGQISAYPSPPIPSLNVSRLSIIVGAAPRTRHAQMAAHTPYVPSFSSGLPRSYKTSFMETWHLSEAHHTQIVPQNKTRSDLARCLASQRNPFDDREVETFALNGTSKPVTSRKRNHRCTICDKAFTRLVFARVLGGAAPLNCHSLQAFWPCSTHGIQVYFRD